MDENIDYSNPELTVEKVRSHFLKSPPTVTSHTSFLSSLSLLLVQSQIHEAVCYHRLFSPTLNHLADRDYELLQLNPGILLDQHI